MYVYTIISFMQWCACFSGHISPCQPNPCDGGGTCEEHDNTFTCFCPSDRTGDRCERRLSENDLRVPMFNGNSFVELLPMKNVEHKLSVEVEFKVGVTIYVPILFSVYFRIQNFFSSGSQLRRNFNVFPTEPKPRPRFCQHYSQRGICHIFLRLRNWTCSYQVPEKN